jgi:hypothetical protein
MASRHIFLCCKDGEKGGSLRRDGRANVREATRESFFVCKGMLLLSLSESVSPLQCYSSFDLSESRVRVPVQRGSSGSCRSTRR